MTDADEDSVLRQILAVTLNPANATGSVGEAPVVYLADLAKVRGHGTALRTARAKAHIAPAVFMHACEPLQSPLDSAAVCIVPTHF